MRENSTKKRVLFQRVQEDKNKVADVLENAHKTDQTNNL